MSATAWQMRRADVAAPLALGLFSAAVALAPNPWLKLALIAPAIAAGIAWWAILRPHRWLALFFLLLLLTPPLPLPLGDSGVHTAPVFAALGILVGLLRMKDWQTGISTLAVAAGAFIGVLLVSLSFAALYSGPDLA